MDHSVSGYTSILKVSFGSFAQTRPLAMHIIAHHFIITSAYARRSAITKVLGNTVLGARVYYSIASNCTMFLLIRVVELSLYEFKRSRVN